MSERSDDDVLALIDRAAAHTPPLHLDRGDVVARGQQIVRRRRAGAGGMVLAAVALAGTAWLGLGGGSLLGSPEVMPASVTWEVDEPTTLTLVDGVTRGGNVSPLTVEKSPDGSASATFTVEGVEETVEGASMAGGADVFVGERATVVVWDQGREAPASVYLHPASQGGGAIEAGPAVGHEDVWYVTTTDRGYVPQDILFTDDRQNVWTAGGLVAQTAQVSDGRHTMPVFALPELGIAGYVDEGGGISTLEEDGLLGSGGTEPWWRGGEDYEFFLARAGDDARFVRQVWVDTSDDRVVSAEEAVPATVVGDAAFAVFSFTRQELPEDSPELAYDFQWSRDGQTWHDRDVADRPVEELPTSLDRVGFTLGADGEPVATKEGVELPASAEQPAGEAWAWDDGDETVVLVRPADGGQQTWFPVLRTDGRLAPPWPFWEGSTTVQVGGEALAANRLPEGTAYLGAVEREGGAEGWRILDGELVPSYDLGPELVVAVDEEQGLWVATRRPFGGEPDLSSTMVGEVDGEGLVLDLDGTRNRVAVLSVTSETVTEDGDGIQGADAMPVLTDGAAIVRDAVQGTGGVSAADGPKPGVTLRSTEVQCLKEADACVEGLDTGGDGGVDLGVRRDTEFAWERDLQPEHGTPVYGPGETVTIHDREYVVRDTPSGWPTLRVGATGVRITTVDDDGRRTAVDAALPAPSVRTVPGAWPWSDDGEAVAVPGLVLPDGLEVVVDVDGAWVEPEQVLVAQGSSGQVTLLVLPPGTTGATGEFGIRGEDGVRGMDGSLLSGPEG